MNSKITQLSKISRLFYKRYKEDVNDIILFGSIMKGKQIPTDIDVLILFRKEINKEIEYDYKKQASKIFTNLSLISKTEDSLKEASFSAREAILFEGYSLIRKKFIAYESGFDSLGIFIYQTKQLSNVEKTKFYYAINGRRGSKGILDSLNAIKLSDNIIAVPLQEIEEAKDFFASWKIEYTYTPSLIPSRLAKKHIIGKVM
jgi:predicted nucleotidyltransferase